MKKYNKYVIIGWWPAWATLGNFLLKNWEKDVVIIEKDLFPRHHVWESLQPDIIKLVKEIWISKEKFDKNFLRKYGAIYKWWKFNDKWSTLYSKELDDKWTNNEKILEIEKYEHWYNVDRAKFDKILLDEFIKKWGKVINKEVKDIKIVDDNIEKIIFSDTKELLWDIFIDCSGQQSIISSKLNMKIFDKFLKNSSIYTYFKWYKSIDSRLNKDFQYIENLWDSWYWWIPISKDVVSIWIVFNSKRKYTSKDFLEKIKYTEIFDSIQESEQVDFKWNKSNKLYYISDWSFLSKKSILKKLVFIMRFILICWPYTFLMSKFCNTKSCLSLKNITFN